MKPYIALNEASYKCPRCSLIVRGRGQLICHVAHACHLPYTLLYDHCIDIWDPETNRLWEPSGPFPFLRLPLEIRGMVYKNVLCYTTIEIVDSFATGEVNPSQALSSKTAHTPAYWRS
ncbi:hypothetical protein AFLA70_30g004911 [Aspergillus flavus AF70]|nr:hypothetical protein AFLA70_30g004911 [Aspergillus flavus AF70]